MTDQHATRDSLTRQRDELQGRIKALQSEEREETQDDTTDTAHRWENAELRSDEMDEAINELKDVENALQRLDQGTYGVCVRCGKPISDERLDVLPDTVLCATCARGDIPTA
jgi:RNA polymerase-binding transcription factor DksA